MTATAEQLDEDKTGSECELDSSKVKAEVHVRVVQSGTL